MNEEITEEEEEKQIQKPGMTNMSNHHDSFKNADKEKHQQNPNILHADEVPVTVGEKTDPVETYCWNSYLLY